MAADARTTVRELVPGQLVDSTFAVIRKDRRRTRTGSPYLALELADRTGRVRATVFDDAPLLDGRFEVGDVIRVLDLVRGTGHFRVSIARGQELVRALRGRISGLAQPTYVLDVPGGHGKVPNGPGYLGDDPSALTVEDAFGGRHRYPG